MLATLAGPLAAASDYEAEAKRLWQIAWTTDADLLERQLAVDEIAAMNAGLSEAMKRGELDEAGLRAVVATAFYLNGLPPDQTRSIEERMTALERATEAAGQLGLAEPEVNSLWRRARLLLSLGDVDGTRALLEQGHAKLELAPAMRPWILVDLGTCARLAGRWDEALDWLQQAEAALDEKSFEAHGLARASVCGEYFEIYLAFGTPMQARVWLEREGAALLSTGTRPEAEYSYSVHKIDLALASEDWTTALAELDRCLASPHMLRVSPDAEAKLLLRRALVWNQAGITEADRTAETFLDALENSALRGKERLLSLLFYAYLELGLGNLDEAEALLERAREPLAEIDVELVDAAYQHAFFASIESRLALLRGESVERLAEHLERAHSSLEDLLAEWEKTPLLPGGIGFLSHGRRRGILSQLIQLELRVHGPERGAANAFDALLRTHELGSHARRSGAIASNLAAVRVELLTPDEALLVYFPSPDLSHLFVVSETELEHHALPKSVDLREAQTRLIRALSTPPKHEASGAVRDGDARRWKSSAARLARQVLPEQLLAKLEPDQPVTVIGFDLRAWFPIESLPLPSGELFGERFVVAHLPSVPFGLELARRAAARGTDRALDMFLLAAPEHSSSASAAWPNLTPLPDDERLFEELTESYDPQRTRRATGSDATAARLESLPRTAVLQLLCHGVYDSSRLMPAGLVLTPESPDSDGLLWVDRAEQLGLADLVLLTACGSARGPQLRGDEDTNHLGGAFLRAGANVVIQAHTELAYESTIELSRHFHAELARPGTTPAQALQRARKKLAGEPRFAHPYYGSALQVSGLGHRAVFEPVRDH